MSLIKCPECGKEISDQSVSCPNCGYPISRGDIGVPDIVPVEVQGASLPKKKFKLLYLCIPAALIVCIVIGVMAHKANSRSEYIANLNSASMEMLSGAAECESMYNLTRSVWYNTIFNKYSAETVKYTKGARDFNDALSALFDDESTTETVGAIDYSKSSVDKLMKSLANPSSEFEGCYETLSSMYDSYGRMVDLATSPTGSLQTYSSEFTSADSDFMSSYDLLQTLIPEE